MVALSISLASSCVGALPDADGYQVAVRSEARALPTYAGDRAGPVDGDLELDPMAALHWATRSAQIEARYSPNIILHDLAGSRGVDVSHYARLGAVSNADAPLRLGGGEEFRYGIYDFASLVQPITSETPTVSPLPAVGTLPFLFTNTAATLAFDPLRRLHFGFSASYLGTGGADAAARALYPFSQGPAGQLRLGYDLGDLSVEETSLEASWTAFSTDASAIIAGATEGWRWRPAPLVETHLSGGAAVVRWSPSPQSLSSTFVVPVARFAVSYGPPHGPGTLQAGVSANVAPFLDRTYVGVYPRADAAVWADGWWNERLGIGARLVSGASLSNDRFRGMVVASGDAHLAYRLEEESRIEVGARADWERQPMVSAASLFFWTIYVSVTLGMKGAL